MQKRFILYTLLCCFQICHSFASSFEEFNRQEHAFKVDDIWYFVPRGYSSFESEDPNLSFGEAMDQSSRLEMQMEREDNMFALSSDKRDREHSFRFLLMLAPCNNFKVKSPPVLRRVLEACPSLRDCKPTVVEKSGKKHKRAKKSEDD